MSPLALPRRPRRPLLVPVTPLVDVLLILLIFFMVTSTYLDLDMIPMADEGARPGQTRPDAAGPDRPAGEVPLLIRLDPGGRAVIAGRGFDPASVGQEILRRGEGSVVILPSPRASVQALVDLLGSVSAAGVGQVTVVRLDGPGE